jgi:hypothetical protein
LFCYRERVVDLDTEIAYGALDFRVAEQELDSPKISRAPVDQGRLRPSQRMRPEQPRIEPDAANPFADQARVLAVSSSSDQFAGGSRIETRRTSCPTLAGGCRRLDGFGRSARI